MPRSSRGTGPQTSFPSGPSLASLNPLQAAAYSHQSTHVLTPDPKTLKLPPRPPPAGELPAPLDFLTPSKFKGDFPLSTNRIENFPPAQIEQDALHTRVVLHPRMPLLLDAFLQHKRANGSDHEQALYSTMTWPRLATRMIEKRPLCFLQSSDLTRLRDNRWIGAKHAEWDRVGTPAQLLNRHLTLDAYLSYDEIMLSSLLAASGPTFFINSGNRFNHGVPADAGVAHEPRGVMVGVVGPRFDRAAQHDSAIICRPPPAGQRSVGGRMDPEVRRMIQQWLLPGVDDVDARPDAAARYRFGDFDEHMYKARLRVSFDVLLLEADARARAAGRDAVVHVVGLGLGVWRKHAAQNGWYVEAFAESLAALELERVSVVEFGWIDGVPRETEEAVAEAAGAKGIAVRFTQEDPCRKLVGGDEGKLLVVTWAWDGNSYVGNEYWNHNLSSSGDPAAVCFSTIGELMNPDINPFAHRVMVVGVGNEEQ
ncbi:uncharacterized protein BKCO1_900086 [Diplodia corticola]|uniref:Uncharacterized protein n=1 Tax=Diplodia corticola TaxID=236234 RepID=A0A1J9SB83_9PEZI|nr:uncharacterized protein BKCO1_900086 [Diplodia corticola]OJD36845.1 hypothetical protein BKCO1_900086 [Diplodia corticola]